MLLRKFDPPRRCAVSRPTRLSWRKYGSTLAIAGAPSERYDPESKPADQLYGFVLCDRFELKVSSLIDEYRQHCSSTNGALCPNAIVSLRDGCILHASVNDGSHRLELLPSELIVHARVDRGDFQLLLNHLHWITTAGRTSEKLPFGAYVLGHDSRTQIMYQVSREAGGPVPA
jgi:hypothetical protein